MSFLRKFAAAALFLAAPALAQTAAIRIEQPWARATPAGATAGAVYMTIDNLADAEDRLTGVSSDAAARTEIHEMKMADGIMKMRAVADGLAVPAHGAAALKPGGYHVMLIGLKKPLTAGEKVVLTLDFAKAGKVEVSAQVMALTSTGSKMDHMKMH
ncbi:copper chaperone PCu(A)C [Rhodoblastus sp.]|uniref:copper chaperone PCu(A)C n=1 Tax=Rhodoblastus sp. TaxID=1962975 RepID=UPI003F9BEA92